MQEEEEEEGGEEREMQWDVKWELVLIDLPPAWIDSNLHVTLQHWGMHQKENQHPNHHQSHYCEVNTTTPMSAYYGSELTPVSGPQCNQ